MLDSQQEQQAEAEMNSSTLQAAKVRLRSLMKARLATLSSDAISSQSHAAFERLSAFKPYQEAKAVGVYLSMPGHEMQTDLIVRHSLASGKQVFVPYLHPSGLPPGEWPARVMDMVSLKGVQDYESLQRDKWGIPSVDGATVHERHRILGELNGEGRSSADPSSLSPLLDLIILPGVAFDFDPDSGALRRLGHGKGFYDYFLRRYYALAAGGTGETSFDHGPSVLLYALAFKEQLLSPVSGEAVPVGPHDQPLDGIILGDGQLKQSSS